MNDTPTSTGLSGRALLNEPTLNKGTAFDAEERARLGLDGLLPPQIESVALQVRRARTQYDALSTDLTRHVFLRAMQDTNEVLFYAFVAEHLEEMLPIIYTPTVGEACEHFSEIYRSPHGLFLSYPDRDRIDELMSHVQGDVDVIVVTDGERILGLGDQGLGGMGIPIGKLSLYTAVGGIDPARTLPILLDVGTDNPGRLADPLYLGWKQRRIRGEEYDAFIETFVQAVKRHFPNALLQWEDFASINAAPLLERYREDILSFNDDIQGTAAVALSAVLAGLSVNEIELEDRPIMVVGAGSAGTGIADMMIAEVRRRTGKEEHNIYVVDRSGVLTTDNDSLADYQVGSSRPRDDAWADLTDLEAIVKAVQPAALVGVSGQPGLFHEGVISALTETERPVVMPLSNPTSKAEATPAEILAWSNGRALVATGSPFEPVGYNGESVVVSQANNVYVFPGLGLGALVAGATRISEQMLAAAAAGVAECSPCSALNPNAGLLPPLADIHTASKRIAVAVAVAAGQDGSAPVIDEAEAQRRIDQRWWEPMYRPIP